MNDIYDFIGSLESSSAVFLLSIVEKEENVEAMMAGHYDSVFRFNDKHEWDSVVLSIKSKSNNLYILSNRGYIYRGNVRVHIMSSYNPFSTNNIFPVPSIFSCPINGHMYITLYDLISRRFVDNLRSSIIYNQ
jgi:hypothetical protein